MSSFVEEFLEFASWWNMGISVDSRAINNLGPYVVRISSCPWVSYPGAPSVHKARRSQAQGSCGDVQTATESEERLGSVRVLHQCKHTEKDGAKRSMDEFWRKLDTEVQLQHRVSGA